MLKCQFVTKTQQLVRCNCVVVLAQNNLCRFFNPKLFIYQKLQTLPYYEFVLIARIKHQRLDAIKLDFLLFIILTLLGGSSIRLFMEVKEKHFINAEDNLYRCGTLYLQIQD